CHPILMWMEYSTRNPGVPVPCFSAMPRHGQWHWPARARCRARNGIGDVSVLLPKDPIPSIPVYAEIEPKNGLPVGECHPIGSGAAAYGYELHLIDKIDPHGI